MWSVQLFAGKSTPGRTSVEQCRQCRCIGQCGWLIALANYPTEPVIYIR
jgi:hypothetical protein